MASGVAPDPTVIAAAIAETLDAVGGGSSSVRVVWTRGDARGLSPANAGAPRLVVTVEPLAGGTGDGGISLAVVRGHRGGLVPAAAKSGNFKAHYDYYSLVLGHWGVGDTKGALENYQLAVERDPRFGEYKTLNERTSEWTTLERRAMHEAYVLWSKTWKP